MYPVAQQTPPPVYVAMQPPMQAPVQAQMPNNTADLENGQNVGDLNVPKNIKEIKG